VDVPEINDCGHLAQRGVPANGVEERPAVDPWQLDIDGDEV